MDDDEIERRRHLSIMAWRERQRVEFESWYQEQCDREYWKIGPCCAGCDHWNSHMGWVGECRASGIVSGEQVLKSLGVEVCTYTPAPGYPFTKAEHRCGLFRDDFDWQSLPKQYLDRIGASKKLFHTPEARGDQAEGEG